MPHLACRALNEAGADSDLLAWRCVAVLMLMLSYKVLVREHQPGKHTPPLNRALLEPSPLCG